MSTHAARTEAPAARRKTPIERMDDHAQECAWRLAEARERNRRDWLSHKGLPLSSDAEPSVLAAHAPEIAFLERCVQTAEWARNRLIQDKEAAFQRSRAANQARRG